MLPTSRYMKNMIIGGLIVVAVNVLAPQTARSQGAITYLSSLGQPSAGSAAVGSDSWQATWFKTGNNPGGYALDSVQLAMTGASGAPSGFTVMLYSTDVPAGPPFPETSLSTLSGSTDPETGGTYTYTASDITLYPSTFYLIVLTAETAVGSGLYAWTFANSSPSSTGGWIGSDYFFTSSDGSSSFWQPTTDDPEFALTATPIPEPETLGLLGVPGLLIFAWRRWLAKAQPPIAR
jgi:hypothetical protein